MSSSIIAQYLNPWKFRREQNAQRLAALRRRDGDRCSRCRRPIRFDLPAGHDLGARIEEILPSPAGGKEGIENLCLTHARCNANAGDVTPEVQERVRQKNEAALLARTRTRRRA
jgi:hypothetical protein